MPHREQGSAAEQTASQSRIRAQAHVLTDHDQIRQRADERGASPACVRGTGNTGDVGVIRLEFRNPGSEPSLEEIDWDQWFQKFDESGPALLVQKQAAEGQQSNFNKLLKRETAEKKSSGKISRPRRGAA